MTMTRLGYGMRGWCVIAVASTAVLALLFMVGPASSDPDPEDVDVQVGLASFYGAGFQGKRTASGEVFDRRRMVAAHRTLPFGSVVQVTNLDNGRQVVLRVVDRGPHGRNYRKGAIIDVSEAAARRLDFVEQGIVRVRVEVLDTPDEDTG